jgi:hypothetical protein
MQRKKPCKKKAKIVIAGVTYLIVQSEVCLLKREQATQIVVFGTMRHLEVVKLKIDELKAEDKSYLRFEEQLSFLAEYAKKDSINDLVDDPPESEMGESLADSVTLAVEAEEETIHATAQTFGHLKKLKLIHIVSKNDAFIRKPKIRQYFLNGVLHRESEERDTSWYFESIYIRYELFLDLIYVAAISKAGHLIAEHYDWTSFFHFFLIYS